MPCIPVRALHISMCLFVLGACDAGCIISPFYRPSQLDQKGTTAVVLIVLPSSLSSFKWMSWQSKGWVCSCSWIHRFPEQTNQTLNPSVTRQRFPTLTICWAGLCCSACSEDRGVPVGLCGQQQDWVRWRTLCDVISTDGLQPRKADVFRKGAPVN